MKVIVTGGTGMVGKAIKELRPDSPEWIYLGSKNYDLRNSESARSLFRWAKPTHLIHLAARVGGVKGNTDFVGDFCTDNLQINSNVLKFAHECPETEKVVSLLSTCVYPDAKHVTYPLTEEQLHNGAPHESNFGYAYAKRMLEVQSRAYNQQYPDGTKFVCAIPNNIYGKHDNFDLDNGHVVPAMVRKAHTATINKFQHPQLWGDGAPLREFTHAKDIARALIFLAENDTGDSTVLNIGTTIEMSIGDAWEAIRSSMGVQYDRVIWDKSKPKGQHRKPSDNSKFLKLYKNATGKDFQYTDFKTGISEVCDWYKKTYPNVRGV